MNNLKVFISSTFRDLDQERDYLVQKVFPEINDELDGITISEVDLRWGITDEESREKRVVDLCLQYLYESKPFFVGILGERYGSIIAPENVELSPLVEEAYPQVGEDLQQGMSVTEIEIINGVFRAAKENQPKAIFFVKESTSPGKGENMAKFQKLQELKRKVLSQKDFPVHTYTELEDLDEVKKFILDSLGKGEEHKHALANSTTPLMIQAYDQRLKTFSHMNDWTSDSPQILAQLQAVIERAKPLAVLEGMEGIGKSALVARLLSNVGGNNRRCLYIYGDAPLLPSTNSLMLGIILSEARRQLQGEYDQNAARKGWSGWITRNFKRIDLNIEQNLVEEMAKQKWCFVLDETCALRLMTISSTCYVLHPLVNAISFLEKSYKIKIDYRVLLVQNSGSPYSASLDAHERFVLPKRQPTDGWRYIDTYLKQYSKHLGAEQLSQLKSCSLMCHPRSVSLVCDYMRLFVRHEQLPAFIKRLTTFTTTSDTYRIYLDRLDTLLTREQARRLTGLISIFSCGPYIGDLKNLCGLSDIDFYRAWACLSRLTVESELGAIRWSNDAIGRLVVSTYDLADSTYRQQLASECSQYFFNEIKDLYTPEKLQGDLRNKWWLFKRTLISSIVDKCSESMGELHMMDDMKLLQIFIKNGVFNLDFIRRNIYLEVKSSIIFNDLMGAMKKSQTTLEEQNGGKTVTFGEVVSESGKYVNEKVWQFAARYREPTIVELTCYLEALREARKWKQLGNELANPEVLNYVWQTPVIIDCWNVAIKQGGVSIIQPDMKEYDKMLLVSYALRNSEGIAYYSKHQANK